VKLLDVLVVVVVVVIFCPFLYSFGWNDLGPAGSPSDRFLERVQLVPVRVVDRDLKLRPDDRPDVCA